MANRTPRSPALTALILALDSANCPCCERRVDGPDAIQDVFGIRVMKRTHGRVEVRVQSYCRKCRSKRAQEAKRVKAETNAICEWLNEING